MHRRRREEHKRLGERVGQIDWVYDRIAKFLDCGICLGVYYFLRKQLQIAELGALGRRRCDDVGHN